MIKLMGESKKITIPTTVDNKVASRVLRSLYMFSPDTKAEMLKAKEPISTNTAENKNLIVNSSIVTC